MARRITLPLGLEVTLGTGEGSHVYGLVPLHVTPRRKHLSANSALVELGRVPGLEVSIQIGLVATDVRAIGAGPGLILLVHSLHVLLELLLGGITYPTYDAIEAGRTARMVDPVVAVEP